jgi:hypothetical protein
VRFFHVRVRLLDLVSAAAQSRGSRRMVTASLSATVCGRCVRRSSDGCENRWRRGLQVIGGPQGGDLSCLVVLQQQSCVRHNNRPSSIGIRSESRRDTRSWRRGSEPHSQRRCSRACVAILGVRGDGRQEIVAEVKWSVCTRCAGGLRISHSSQVPLPNLSPNLSPIFKALGVRVVELEAQHDRLRRRRCRRVDDRCRSRHLAGQAHPR